MFPDLIHIRICLGYYYHNKQLTHILQNQLGYIGEMGIMSETQRETTHLGITNIEIIGNEINVFLKAHTSSTPPVFTTIHPP